MIGKEEEEEGEEKIVSSSNEEEKEGDDNEKEIRTQQHLVIFKFIININSFLPFLQNSACVVTLECKKNSYFLGVLNLISMET